MNGNGGYADTPAVSLQFPAFTITCWVKVLEPAKTPGYVYADWSSPHQFSIWVHGDWKVIFFQFRNKNRKDVLAMYTWVLNWQLKNKRANNYINLDLISHHILGYSTMEKIPLNWRKPENNSLLRKKNTKEALIKETRMVKDGKDWHKLQATNLKKLG